MLNIFCIFAKISGEQNRSYSFFNDYNMAKEQDNILEEVTGGEYKYGFVTHVETEMIEKGLNEEVIRTISAKKEEPEWLLEFRLKAYRHWLTMKMPEWAQLDIPEINYQDIVY